MIALPVHVCRDGVTLDGCGPLDANNVATCTTRRTWRKRQFGGKDALEQVDADGCGARFPLDRNGLRVKEV